VTDKELLDAIDRVVARGGSVDVSATDPLNPQRNAQARVITDVGLRNPTNVLRGGATGREALRACFQAIGHRA
jgi:hypothetical protein